MDQHMAAPCSQAAAPRGVGGGTGEGERGFVAWVSCGDGGKGVEIESAASQVMQIISFNLLLKITQSQAKEGLYGLSHCYCQGVTDLSCI